MIMFFQAVNVLCSVRFCFLVVIATMCLVNKDVYNAPKLVFGPGRRWGSLRRSPRPDPIVCWGGGQRLTYPSRSTPFGESAPRFLGPLRTKFLIYACLAYMNLHWNVLSLQGIIIIIIISSIINSWEYDISVTDSDSCNVFDLCL